MLSARSWTVMPSLLASFHQIVSAALAKDSGRIIRAVYPIACCSNEATESAAHRTGSAAKCAYLAVV
jgi:hypothetical protein